MSDSPALLKVLMPLGDIPVGSVVTKKTGEKEYTVRTSIFIPNGDGGRTEVKASDGVRFLVSNNGDIYAAPQESVHAWLVLDETLLEYLQNKLEGEPQ